VRCPPRRLGGSAQPHQPCTLPGSRAEVLDLDLHLIPVSRHHHRRHLSRHEAHARLDEAHVRGIAAAGPHPFSNRALSVRQGERACRISWRPASAVPIQGSGEPLETGPHRNDCRVHRSEALASSMAAATGDGDARCLRQRPLLETCGEHLAIEERNHEVVSAARVADVEDAADVGMIEGGDRACFALEAGARSGISRTVRGEDPGRHRGRAASPARDTPRPCRRRRGRTGSHTDRGGARSQPQDGFPRRDSTRDVSRTRDWTVNRSDPAPAHRQGRRPVAEMAF
jgi:hypothetical protein